VPAPRVPDDEAAGVCDSQRLIALPPVGAEASRGLREAKFSGSARMTLRVGSLGASGQETPERPRLRLPGRWDPLSAAATGMTGTRA